MSETCVMGTRDATWENEFLASLAGLARPAGLACPARLALSASCMYTDADRRDSKAHRMSFFLIHARFSGVDRTCIVSPSAS